MTEVVTIYMPLLDEGTNVWRPVTAECLGQGTYRIIGPQPHDEKWAFAPGTVVAGKPRRFANGVQGTVALTISDWT